MFRLSFLALCCVSLTFSSPTKKFETVTVKLETKNLTLSDLTNLPVESRIINGNEAPHTPWVGRIITYWQNGGVASNCGASLISNHWVLTARHCIADGNGLNQGPLWVSLGNNNFYQGRFISVALISSFTTPDHDIALLKLSEDVNDIGPIAWQYDDNLNYGGHWATIYGWGQTESGGGSDTLRTTNVVLWGRESCEQNMVCVNPEITNTNCCFGDSGGPMILEDNGHWRQIGVATAVSVVNGVPCTGNKSWYTSTAYYRDWIRDTIRN